MLNYHVNVFSHGTNNEGAICTEIFITFCALDALLSHAKNFAIVLLLESYQYWVETGHL